jgi:glycerol-3-phosphate dehydrogenase
LRVRAALAEREVWLRIAPHLVRPLRFVIPAHSDERPPWLLRLGVAALRPAGSRPRLPASMTIDVTHHPVGNALKRPFGTAFEYSDCVVDDSRLVIANARRCRGAGCRYPHRRALRSRRPARYWRLVVIDRGHRQVITARALANATGAWTASVAETVLRMPPPAVGVTKISQIVVRRLFDIDNVYVFQNSDRRLIFASPYQRDFTLIGTVADTVQGRSRGGGDGRGRCRLSLRRGQPVFSRAYRTLRRDQDRFRRQQVMAPPASGARAMADGVRYRARQGAAADDLRRRGHDLAAARGAGGVQADAVLSDVAALDRDAPLPGGDFAWARFDDEVDRARERWRFPDRGARPGAWSPPMARVLKPCWAMPKNRADLGPGFGPELTARRCAIS